MNPLDIYQSREVSRWSRVGMLVALYDGAIEACEFAGELPEDNPIREKHVAKARRIVIGIVSGLDPTYGEIPENVKRLCLHMLECLDEGRVHDAARILRPLRDGFAAIQDEADELERRGELPRPSTNQTL